jgi:predicted PurR-regulated permease PerM
LYFTAWLVQFFFTPVVDFMARRHVPRLLAVSYVYLVLVLLVVITLVAVTPAIYNQGQRLANELAKPQTYTFIQHTANNFEKFLEAHGVRQQDIKVFTEQYGISFQNGAVQAGTKIRGIIQEYLNFNNVSHSATTFFNFLGTLNAYVLNFVIILILAFYMTLDGHKLMRRLLSYFPPAVGEVMESFNGIVNRKFGGYLRGQFILSASYGLLTFVIAQGFSLQYPIFIAVFAAVMMLIPFVGTFLAVIPPLLAYLLVHLINGNFSLGGFLLLLVFLFISQHIVLNLLAPRVMSSTVGMHPLLVVLGLLLGVQFAGIWGAIFGVPVFGVFIDTIDLIYRRVMERRFGFHPPDAGEWHDDEEEPGQPPSPPSLSDAKGGDGDAEETHDAEKTARLPRAGVRLRPAPGRRETHP